MTQPRKVERVRSFMSAQVMFNAMPAIDCVVRNYSNAGVRLEIPDRTPLPNEFDLNIPHKGRIFHARVAWRSEGIVGAEFVEKIGATGAEAAGDSDDDRLDRAMRENARLRAQILQLKQRVAQLTGEA